MNYENYIILNYDFDGKEWEQLETITEDDIQDYFLIKDYYAVKKLFCFLDFQKLRDNEDFVYYFKKKCEKKAKSEYERYGKL